MAEEIIQLPNVPAEYHYVQRQSCASCGQPVQGNRLGSRPSDDGRMHDIWDLTCTKCGATRRVVLSVPMVDIFGMLGLKKDGS
jgi:hypothetical protein